MNYKDGIWRCRIILPFGLYFYKYTNRGNFFTNQNEKSFGHDKNNYIMVGAPAEDRKPVMDRSVTDIIEKIPVSLEKIPVRLEKIPVCLVKTNQITPELFEGVKKLIQEIPQISLEDGGVRIVCVTAITERVKEFFATEIFDPEKDIPLVLQRVGPDGFGNDIHDEWGTLVIISATFKDEIRWKTSPDNFVKDLTKKLKH